MTSRLTPTIVLLFLSLTLHAAPPTTMPSQPLTDLVTSAVRDIQKSHPDYNLKDPDISITLIDLRNPSHLSAGTFNGDSPRYPASVVKLFYLAAAHQWMQDGKLADTPELRRGLQAMIVNSDNDATAYILYCLTDAPNGAELPPDQMKDWEFKRNSVNRYFSSLGYTNVNACQTPYSFGPFGREKFFMHHGQNRNSLTTNNTSLLLTDIVLGHFLSPDHSHQMMELLHRDMTTKSEGHDDQAHGFSAMALTPDYHLYSKAGWNNDDRHDSAYIESPDGKLKFVLTTYTLNHARQRDIIPSIVKSVLAKLPSISPN